MVNINLYRNTSDDRKLDKNLTSLGSVTAEFKGDVNIMTPTLKLSYSDALKNSNYVYIPELSRYYFIKTITLSQQLAFIELQVDVLTTYKTSIRQQNAIIKRQESPYNANHYLDDENFKALEYSRIQTKTFTNGFDVNSYILTIAGGR